MNGSRSGGQDAPGRLPPSSVRTARRPPGAPMSADDQLRTLIRRIAADPLGALRLVVVRVRDEPAYLLRRLLGMVPSTLPLLPSTTSARIARSLGAVGRWLALVAPRAGWPLLLRLIAMEAGGERARAIALARRLGPTRTPRGR